MLSKKERPDLENLTQSVVESFLSEIATMLSSRSVLKQLYTNMTENGLSTMLMLCSEEEDFDKELVLFKKEAFSDINLNDLRHILSIAIGRSCSTKMELGLLLDQFSLPALVMNVSASPSDVKNRISLENLLLVCRALELLEIGEGNASKPKP